MARLDTSIITAADKLYAGRNPTLDLTRGGQFGYAPVYDEWLNNQAYVRRNARVILLQAPKLFANRTNGTKLVQHLKALLEVHPKIVTGFDFGLTLNTAPHPLGASGQMQQEPTKTVRAESSPTLIYQSKIGRPEQRLFSFWIHSILDPNTTFSSALYSTDINPTAVGEILDGKFYADQYAATILVFEPNQSFTHVEKAAIVHNFYPLTTGPITLESNPVDDLQLEELQINFAGIVEPCEGAVELASQLLTDMRSGMRNANPCTVPSAYTLADAKSVAAGAGNRETVGFRYQVEKVSGNQLGGNVQPQTVTV
jgi:hypothetical protein